MSVDPQAILEACGLEEEAIALLTSRVEVCTESETDLLVQSAIVAAGDPSLLSTALPRLLERLSTAAAPSDEYVQGVCRHLDGLVAWRVKRDVPAATCALHRSLDVLEGAADPRALAYVGRVLDTLGQMLQGEGLLVDARREYERALARKEEAHDAPGAALTHGNLGRLCRDLGDFQAAAEHLARDLEYVEESHPEQTRVRSQLGTELGACLTESGQLDAAAAHLDRSLTLANESEDPIGSAFALVHRGRLALARGDADAAAACSAQVAELTVKLPSTVADAVGGLLDHLEAEVARHRGEVETALGHFAAAAARYRTLARVSPVEHAELLAAWAEALLEAGHEREAADRLRDALRHLDMSTAADMRARIDARLRAVDETAWMLHSAGRFIGHGQIEILLGETGRAGFRGRDEDVTVLFSDLRSFTAVTEGLEPDVLIATLNRYLSLMTRCVEHFGGYVDKFIGDAVMAVFSLPTPAADDADRATSAAIYMGIELDRMNRSLPPGLPCLAAGVGLHAGSVVAGLIGSPRKRAYTVIGDAVNTASRLEGMTKQLGVPVLISEEVRRRLAADAPWRLLPLGRYRPKGRQAPVEVWGVLGPQGGGDEARHAERRIALATQAMDSFWTREFAAALGAFEVLGDGAPDAPGAKGYALLAAAARELLQAPPAEDWDGSIVLTEK